MKRSSAFFLHLAISATVVGVALAIIFFVWYPHPWFEIAGAWRVVQVLVGVDLVLGPALTLLLYKPGKPRVVFDLMFVAAIQMAALVYGLTTIYSQRPLYNIFAVDRFVMVAAADIDRTTVPPAVIDAWPNTGPLYAVAELPTDQAEQQALLFELLEGAPDIEFRPNLWKPWPDAHSAALARLKPLSSLADVSTELAAYALATGRDDWLCAPIVTPSGEFLTLIIDPNELTVLDVIAVDLFDLIPTG